MFQNGGSGLRLPHPWKEVKMLPREVSVKLLCEVAGEDREAICARPMVSCCQLRDWPLALS